MCLAADAMMGSVDPTPSLSLTGKMVVNPQWDSMTDSLTQVCNYFSKNTYSVVDCTELLHIANN